MKLEVLCSCITTAESLLLPSVRFCVIIPACGIILAYTYTTLYIRRPNLLLVPCFIFACGLIAYSVVGKDPGYGTLALMIVFTYSFTPIDFIYCSILSFTEIVTFVVLLFQYAEMDQSDRINVTGMLALFWTAVAFVGHNLESSLRRAFLHEIVLRRQRDMLSVEKKRGDQLLSNMLPKQIANQLKAGRGVVADEFESVTVLFCEICDWANVTAKVDADSVRNDLRFVVGVVVLCPKPSVLAACSVAHWLCGVAGLLSRPPVRVVAVFCFFSFFPFSSRWSPSSTASTPGLTC